MIDFSTLPRLALPEAWQPRPFDSWGKIPVGSSEDLRRIVALPRRVRPEGARETALIEYMTTRFAVQNPRCRCAALGRECITRLRLAQAWALYEIGLTQGLLGPIGVGHGKSALDLLAPLAIPNCRVALLLVPAKLLSQIIAERELMRQHFRVTSMIVHGTKYHDVSCGAPVMHVLSYERLSIDTSTALLDALQPDLIIADEAHRLRHASAVRTKRVLRYFVARPATRFCGWSGSLTDTSLADYQHLAAMALKKGSPLPLDPATAKDWCRAITPDEYPAPPGALQQLCAPGEHVNEGFHRRLTETIGVVSTNAPAVTAELRILERKAPPIPDVVASALDAVRETWCRPDGEEFVDELQQARCLRELACGFYYRWTFPRGEPTELIDEWFATRKAWRQELRVQLQDSVPHMDSPKLAALAAKRAYRLEPNGRVGRVWYVNSEEAQHDLPCWSAATWLRWVAVRDRVEPVSCPVRVHEFLARDAAEWARTHRGIVWYAHRAFGQWVSEIGGHPLHQGGPDAGRLIGLERGESIVASIKSHGEGRDGLQRVFNDQLVANPPSSNSCWEQLLGRLHRIGQAEPVVSARFYRHTPELEAHVTSALAKAHYVATTMGEAQKVQVL